MLIKPLALVARIGMVALCLIFSSFCGAIENPLTTSNKANLSTNLCDLLIEDVLVRHETCSVSNDGSITIRAKSSSRIEYSFDGGNTFGLAPLRMGLSQARYEVVVRSIDNPSCSESFEVVVDYGEWEETPVMAGASFCKGFDASNFSGLMASPIGDLQEQTLTLSGTEKDLSWNWWNRTEDCSILRTTESVAFFSKAFTVNETGTYSITNTQHDWDGVISIYRDSFDPANPFDHCIAYNDDDQQAGESKIDDLILEQCQTYFFVISGKNHDDLGSFTTEVSGPGNIIEPETGACFSENSGLGGKILWFDVQTEDGYSNPIATGNLFNPLGTPYFDPKLDVNVYYVAIEYRDCYSEKIPLELITGDCNIEISDPCSCRNNATTLENGQFNETVQVTGPSGVVWRVLSNDGLYRPRTPLTSLSTRLVPLGRRLREVPLGGGQSDYFLDGVHTDALGYRIEVTDGTTVLEESNTCYYPNPMILNLSNYVCTQTPAFTLQGNADQPGSGAFSIDGVGGDFFDPSAIGPGTSMVSYEFDADGSPGPGITEPGCIQEVTQEVTIDDDPNVACIRNINVGLGTDCEVEITVNMVQAADQCMTPGAYSIVVKDLDSNVVVNNIITAVGKYFAEVTNTTTGNSCWGYVHVEDKIAPQIFCPDNLTIHCLDSRDTSVTGVPTAVDNCDSLRFYFTDLENLNACGTGTITRKWTVEDQQGNSDECEQIITIEDRKKVKIVWPRDLTLDCVQTVDDLHPDNLSRRFSRPRYNSDCRQLADGFDDETYDICSPGSFKILRNWKIYDWCDRDTVFEYVQTIKVIDTIAPIITCPNDEVIEVRHNDCDVRIPNLIPVINDNCDTDPSYTRTIYDQNNNIVTGRRIGPGSYRFFYEAQDDCGNTDTCSHTVEIVDPIAPSPLCDKNTNVTLSNSGFAEVCYTTIDDFSTDNCSIAKYEIKKDGEDDSRYRDCIQFRCRDLGVNKVHLRVTDIYGNSNTCWANVYIEDKSPPVITCPPDITVSCLTDFNDPERTGGYPNVDGRCQNLTADFVDQSNHPTCDAQIITRTWRVEKTLVGADGILNTSDDIVYSDECEQTITVVDSTEVVIEWPSDLVIPCTQNAISTAPGDLVHYNNGTIFYDRPRISEEDCEHLGINFTDKEYQLCGPESYKIRRTWHIVDWCSDLDTVYSQTIWIQDKEAPDILAFNVVADITVNGTCEAYVTVDAQASDNCTQVTMRNNSPFALSGNANASGYYPKGETLVTFTATDACGNKSEETIKVTVRDRKNPLAICGNGYAINLKSTGQAEICAEMFDRGSSDNCTFQANLEFFIQRLDAQSNPEGGRERCLVFDCEDLEDAPLQRVDFIVVDADGNEAHCQSNLFLQDNDDFCEGARQLTLASIQGNVKSENGSSVDDIDVYLNNLMNKEGMNGHYSIDSLPVGNTYQVRMNRLGSPDEGVSVLDMILVRSHILKIDSLDSPYQMIAADVNEDGKISTIDIIEMRQLILQIINDFSGGINWVFIPEEYEFPYQTNPWYESYPDYSEITLQHDISDADFIAVKKGDVDQSAFFRGSAQRGAAMLTYTDRSLKPGKSELVRIELQEEARPMGAQFLLEFNEIDHSQIEYLGGSVEPSGLSIITTEEGTLVQVAWIQKELKQVDDFYLDFRILPREEMMLSEVIGMGPGDHKIVSDNYQISDLTLGFERGSLEEDGSLFLENAPNPFLRETTISFVMPQSDVASLEIYDLSGNRIWGTTAFFQKGKNKIEVSAADLGVTGVLICQLRSGSFIESSRMMILE